MTPFNIRYERQENKSFNYQKGNLIKKGEEFIFPKSKSGIREYKEKIEQASSREDLFKLGFDEHECDEERVVFVNKKGDQVAFNFKTNQVEKTQLKG